MNHFFKKGNECFKKQIQIQYRKDMKERNIYKKTP